MAGDWIKMRTALGAEKATMVICDMTGLDEFAVVGRLHAIWVWAGEHTVTGEVSGVTLKTVDRVTRFDGFGESMRVAGWLEVLPDGGLRFPKWKRHNSKAAKERALAAARAAKSRQKKRDAHRDEDRDATVTNHAPREEKRRREKKREEKQENPLPLLLQTPDFALAWNDWQQHRQELKKPLKPTMAIAQLKMLADWGHDRAIAAIRHTIAMGWQGIREPESTAGNGRPQNVCIGGLNDAT